MTAGNRQWSVVSENFFCFALSALLLAVCLPADAQQAKKVPRIGMLLAGSVSSMKGQVDAFQQGLRELGYVEGKTIAIEYRYAEGNRDTWPKLAAEIVRLKPDVIVVGSAGFTAAAKRATSTIPIVVGSAGDLVGTQL